MPFLVLKGKVEAGKKFGSKIGFPTINIKVPRLIKKDQWGVYFSLVKIGQGIYPGLTHLGPPKTFGLRAATCETHLLTWKGDLYGQLVEKKLIFRFREIQKFPQINHLKKQLKRDVKIARKYFGL